MMVRSFLYVPGDRRDRIGKALRLGVDAVLIDLEDAVAPAAKASARAVAVEVLQEPRPEGTPVWVRINAGDVGRLDLEAIGQVADRVRGVVLAKCDTIEWLQEVADSTSGQVLLSPLVESALAVRRLDELCAHPRVHQCHLGEIDLLADLGAGPDGADRLLDHARCSLVLASAAAGILPPIGGVYADVRDLDGLAVTSRVLRDLGFGGRPAIHPAQVEVINEAFTPSETELSVAAELVAQYDDALRRGEGAVAAADGSMLDEAVVRRARRVLGHARRDAIRGEDGK